MRVSSNAPALSRRSIMRGMAAALVGASVPVAAIAGLTARKLTVDADAELFSKCRQWHDRRRSINRMGKVMNALHEEAKNNVPPVPAELFEKIRLAGCFVATPDCFKPKEPWSRLKLLHYVDAEVKETGRYHTPESKEQARRLLAIRDSYDAAVAKTWKAHDKQERKWERELSKNWKLFSKIGRIKADTHQGIAAQANVLMTDGFLTDSEAEEHTSVVFNILRSVQRLAAAQAA